MENEKEMTVSAGTAPSTVQASTEMGALLQMAVSQDLDTEKLEKLIELKNREEERHCKKDFDFHFAEMQKCFEPVKRGKDGYGYKYAPIDVMQKKYGPIISDHGFSYRWRESALDNGGKKVTLIISGWGHTDDSTSFDIPKLDATKQQNAAQVLGSMSTYGKRYTFMSGFGIIVEDEDDDAAALNFEDGIAHATEINYIRACNTMEELKDTFKALYTGTNDRTAQQIFSMEKDKRKKELTSGTAK